MSLATENVPESPVLAPVGLDLKVKAGGGGVGIPAGGAKVLDEDISQGCAHGAPSFKIPPNCPHINDVSSRKRC
jgi:hypothetical protein